MSQTKNATIDKRDKKSLNMITKQIVEQEKEDNKGLQKVALMSYLSS